jgi:N-acetylglutamate synthase/N-acetylornithine aminotransferase
VFFDFSVFLTLLLRYQTSAKENENVNEAINFLVKKVIENVASDADQSRDDTITLVANSNENTKPEKQCCWNS